MKRPNLHPAALPRSRLPLDANGSRHLGFICYIFLYLALMERLGAHILFGKACLLSRRLRSTSSCFHSAYFCRIKASIITVSHIAGLLRTLFIWFLMISASQSFVSRSSVSLRSATAVRCCKLPLISRSHSCVRLPASRFVPCQNNTCLRASSKGVSNKSHEFRLSATDVNIKNITE